VCVCVFVFVCVRARAREIAERVDPSLCRDSKLTNTVIPVNKH